MNFKYFPHTDADVQQMLAKIGVNSMEDLFAQVPESIRLHGDYNLPLSMSEIEVRQVFEKLGSQNRQLTCFAGGGVYDHYTPSVVTNILQRSELLTCYTPYQPEVSQGTLQYMFEFQSMMTLLTDMDVANASMYDGTTATAEAVLMAVRAGKKQRRVLISSTVDPKTVEVVKTYARVQGISLEMIDACDGVTSRAHLDALLAEGGVAGVVVQQPNYYGIVEDYSGVADAVHEKKGLFIMNSIAADLAVLKTPGEWGADIAVGDGQSLGIPMQWGGPYVGYMCCTQALLRKLPGRIVGKTENAKEQRVFTLTLQAREQHIRREKATSNICSNQSLMALFVTICMSLLGKHGLREAAELSYAGAHYLYDRLLATGLFEPVYQQPFFNEFVVRFKGDVTALQDFWVTNGILGGIRIADDQIMFAVTEKRSKEEIDRMVDMVPFYQGAH